MPLYEYQCNQCSHRFERIRKFADPPLNVCPECGGALEQLISAPAIQFKGAGWYVTDYAKKSSTQGSSGTNGKSGNSASSKTDAADTKPEVKAESKPAGGPPAASDHK